MKKEVDSLTEKFLEVLSAVIHENAFNAGGFSQEGWTTIISYARKHNVFPLIFEAASESTQFAEHPAYYTYISEAMSIVAGQVKRTAAFLDLYHSFVEANYYPIVMKGVVCRQLYGKLSDHRPSGDEDILIKTQDFDKVRQILIQCGYVPEKESISEAELNITQEFSFHNNKQGLTVDVHISPMGHENELRSQMNKYFQDVFIDCIKMEINSETIYTMSYTDHFLFLILHTFRHFTGGGFGIRQVLDILLFEQSYYTEINWDYIIKVLKEVRADYFFGDLQYIGNKYLGFKLSTMCESKCPEELLEDLMSSGTFGNGTPEQVIAHQMTNAAMQNINNKQKNKKSFITVWQTIFPNMRYMAERYPELGEKPWLILQCWIHRWKKFLNFNKSSGGNLALKGTKISQKRIELLQKYDIL